MKKEERDANVDNVGTSVACLTVTGANTFVPLISPYILIKQYRIKFSVYNTLQPRGICLFLPNF